MREREWGGEACRSRARAGVGERDGDRERASNSGREREMERGRESGARLRVESPSAVRLGMTDRSFHAKNDEFAINFE